MSVFSAINTALSGMTGESDRLTSISNNISNSSAVGYKEVDTQFQDLVLGDNATGAAALGGTQTVDRMDVSKAGQITSTGVNTDLAVSGNGFLVVNTNANAASGQYLVTRAGSFRPDANGNLANAAGYFLQGVPLDASGNPTTPGAGSTVDSLSTVSVSNLTVAAAPTKTMTFNANLPSGDTAYSATPPTPPQTSVDYFDPLGNTHTMTFQFTPSVPATATAAPTNTWTMNIYDSASATLTTPVGSATLTFNATGAAAGTLAAVTPTAGTYSAGTGVFTVPTGAGGPLAINIGAVGSAAGMTQLAGSYTTTNIQKDGSAFGLLQGVSVTSAGQVVANFSNGATRPIYQLELGSLPNPDGLAAVTGDAFALSPESGQMQLQQPGQGTGGTIQGGALEGSNVDIGTELTNLIETQRAYESSATVVRTGDQMLSTLNQLKQ